MHVKGQWPPKGPSEAKQIPPRILDIACKATSTILSLLRLSRVWGGLRFTPIPPPDIPLEQLAISRSFYLGINIPFLIQFHLFFRNKLLVNYLVIHQRVCHTYMEAGDDVS